MDGLLGERGGEQDNEVRYLVQNLRSQISQLWNDYSNILIKYFYPAGVGFLYRPDVRKAGFGVCPPQ